MEHVEKALADGYSVEEIAKTFGLPKVQVELIRDVTARRAAASEARKAAMPKPTMTAKDARTRLTAFDPNLADDLKRAERELKEKQEQVNQAFEQHRTTKPGTLQYDVTKKKLEDMMQRRSIFQREFQRLEKELRSGSADAIAAIFPDKGEANVIIDYSGLLGSKNKPNGQPMLPSASQRAGVDAAKQGLQKFTKLIGPGRIDGKTVKFSVTPDGREFYRASNNTVALKKAGSQLKTVVHEMGHWLEEHEPETYKTAKAFLEKRTQGEIAQPMSKLTGNKNYDIQEVAKPDKFPDAYVGKVYHGATEVVSMGLEYMVTDPMKFAKTDPEYFDLIYDIINGVHL